MIKIRFYWQQGEKSGSFLATAKSVKECMALAQEAIEDEGAEMVGYVFTDMDR